jgi:hypothetical protein
MTVQFCPGALSKTSFGIIVFPRRSRLVAYGTGLENLDPFGSREFESHLLRSRLFALELRFSSAK